MEREEIKEIVYHYLSNLFYNEHEFEIMMTSRPNDGEDQMLYKELILDSLDILTFIIELENKFNIQIEDKLFKNDCTCRDIIDYIYDKLK